MSEVWKTPIGFTHTSTISAATATVKPLSYEIVRNCVDVPWVSVYLNKGIRALTESNYGNNHRNMSLVEEEDFLAKYRKLAEKGQIVEVGTIKAAYEERVGHRIGSGQIYYVLHRHDWRKIMPRSKHPNKASDEEIVSSKKLTHELTN
jgi:transposase